MSGEKELYDGNTANKWYAELMGDNNWVRRHLLSVFSLFDLPQSFLDVGCGTGMSVLTARQLGMDAFGVDQLIGSAPPGDWTHEEGWFSHADLRKPWNLTQIEGAPSVVDMVISWEVAEHIPRDNAHIFIQTIASHVKIGGMLIFTSAHPGQGGTEHIGIRPAHEWREMFHERGLTYRQDYTERLVVHWLGIRSPLMWLSSNVQIFVRGNFGG